jgi:hypothetical protein
MVDSVSKPGSVVQVEGQPWTVDTILGHVVPVRRSCVIIRRIISTRVRSCRLSQVVCSLISDPPLFIAMSPNGGLSREEVLEATATAMRRRLVLRSRIVVIVRHFGKGMLGID